VSSRSGSGARLRFVQPLLPTLAETAPAGDEWLHELKHDAYRTLLVANSGDIRAFTRNGHDWTANYDLIVQAAAKRLRGRSAIIDGEVIVPTPAGLSDINAIKSAIAHSAQRLVFMAFDLLHLAGADLRRSPLRRQRL
jgi:ATP-dependent DNA ligase